MKLDEEAIIDLKNEVIVNLEVFSRDEVLAWLHKPKGSLFERTMKAEAARLIEAS